MHYAFLQARLSHSLHQTTFRAQMEHFENLIRLSGLSNVQDTNRIFAKCPTITVNTQSNPGPAQIGRRSRS